MSKSMRSGVVKAGCLRKPRRFAQALGLGAALLIATGIGTANAQDLSGSWQKVRQGCKPGQLTCQIKGRFTVQNLGSTVAPASSLGVYLSNDEILDATDTLLQGISVSPVAPGETNSVKMALVLADLVLGISASNSFLIAVVDDGNLVPETNEVNNVAVFKNPRPAGIVIFDRAFAPDTVTINVDTRVRWMHRDSEDHTVTSGACDAAGDCFPDGNFTSGPEATPLSLFGEFVHVFDTPGAFPFFCEIHGDKMTGTIIVDP